MSSPFFPVPIEGRSLNKFVMDVTVRFVELIDCRMFNDEFRGRTSVEVDSDSTSIIASGGGQRAPIELSLFIGCH